MSARIMDPIGRLMGLRYKSHPWHGIEIGLDAPKVITCFIEMVPTDTVKYEVDKVSGYLRIDRPQKYSNVVPALYGFIPQTYCDDNDPLDIVILSQIEIQPMCLVNAKVIGVMRMLDRGEMDDKIIAVADNDMSVNHINSIDELPRHFFRELKNFFEDYKKLEHKEVVVEDFQNKETAIEIVKQSIIDYNNKFRK